MAPRFNLQTFPLTVAWFAAITVCANVHCKNFFRVNVLTTSETSGLDLEDYKGVMDLAPTVVDNSNISFYGLMEDLRAELLYPNTVAIIGSGEPVVDGVALLFASCLGVPLINVRKTTALLEVGL